jgi:SAM-dependent methyltransferase
MKLYEPQKYWEKRLKSNFNIRGVGNIVFGKRYNQLLYKLQLTILKKAINKFTIHLEGKRILDVGSGTGFFSAFFLSNLGKVIGLDITRASVESLNKSFPNGKFIILDISEEIFLEPALSESFFDIVNAQNVMFHITEETRFVKALENLAKSLAPGGYLLITDFFGAEDYSPAQHVIFRCLEKYEILEQSGIKILEIMPIYHFMNRRLNGLPLRINNRMAPFLFIMDYIINKIGWLKGKDIKLLIARKKA